MAATEPQQISESTTPPDVAEFLRLKWKEGPEDERKNMNDLITENGVNGKMMLVYSEDKLSQLFGVSPFRAPLLYRLLHPAALRDPDHGGQPIVLDWTYQWSKLPSSKTSLFKFSFEQVVDDGLLSTEYEAMRVPRYAWDHSGELGNQQNILSDDLFSRYNFKNERNKPLSISYEGVEKFVKRHMKSRKNEMRVTKQLNGIFDFSIEGEGKGDWFPIELKPPSDHTAVVDPSSYCSSIPEDETESDSGAASSLLSSAKTTTTVADEPEPKKKRFKATGSVFSSRSWEQAKAQFLWLIKSGHPKPALMLSRMNPADINVVFFYHGSQYLWMELTYDDSLRLFEMILDHKKTSHVFWSRCAPPLPFDFSKYHEVGSEVPPLFHRQNSEGSWVGI